MIEAQNSKYAIAAAPGAILKNATATAVAVDTKGYDYAELIIAIGANDAGVTALKLTECDESGGSYTDVPKSAFGTDADITGTKTVLPSATDANEIVAYQVNLLGRKRFLKIVLTAANVGTGAYVSAVARLSRGDMPVTNAQAGALAVVRTQ